MSEENSIKVGNATDVAQCYSLGMDENSMFTVTSADDLWNKSFHKRDHALNRMAKLNLPYIDRMFGEYPDITKIEAAFRAGLPDAMFEFVSVRAMRPGEVIAELERGLPILCKVNINFEGCVLEWE